MELIKRKCSRCGTGEIREIMCSFCQNTFGVYECSNGLGEDSCGELDEKGNFIHDGSKIPIRDICNPGCFERVKDQLHKEMQKIRKHALLLRTAAIEKGIK